jgi:hypothetical protein
LQGPAGSGGGGGGVVSVVIPYSFATPSVKGSGFTVGFAGNSSGGGVSGPTGAAAGFAAFRTTRSMTFINLYTTLTLTSNVGPSAGSPATATVTAYYSPITVSPGGPPIFLPFATTSINLETPSATEMTYSNTPTSFSAVVPAGSLVALQINTIPPVGFPAVGLSFSGGLEYT